jgi:hypothetical protein
MSPRAVQTMPVAPVGLDLPMVSRTQLIFGSAGKKQKVAHPSSLRADARGMPLAPPGLRAGARGTH